MNSFDRIWMALSLEEPDRIPTHTINIDGNVADMILGKPERTAFDIFNEMEQKYPDEWVEKINQILDDIEIGVFAKCVRAGYELGFDGVGIQYIPFILESQIHLVSEYIIGNGCTWHFIDDGIHLLFLPRYGHFLDNVIGKEIYKILVGEIMVDPVCHKNIEVPIVVHIKDQRAPTPVGLCHATVESNFRK